jgi:tetratricopeptide (TPR) repeat protein
MLEAGDPQGAVPVLRAFINKRGPDAEGYCLLGAALSQLGNRAESDSYLRKALDLDPNLALAVRLLAVSAFESGKLASATKHFSRLLQLSPGDEEARVFLAQIALAHHDYAGAVAHFRLAKSLLRDDAHLQVLMAQALIGGKRTTEGRRMLLAVQTEDPVIVFEVGRLLLEAGDAKPATERFIRIRGNYPAPAALEYNLALAWFRLGDYGAAVETLEPLAKTGLADADVYSLLGDAYRRQNRPQEAFAALREAVALVPGREQFSDDLLSLCVELLAIDPGLEIAEAALRNQPGNYRIYAQRAQLYALKGEPKRAEADYRAAIRSSPKTSWLYLGLAMSLMLDDRLEEARATLEPRLRQSSGYYCFYLYSEVLTRLGLGGEARGYLERAVSMNPDFAPARVNLGRVYAGDKDWPKAIAQFRRAIALDPGDKRSYYELARIFRQTGDLEQAGAMLAQVRKFNEQERADSPEQSVIKRLEALRQAAREQPGK